MRDVNLRPDASTDNDPVETLKRGAHLIRVSFVHIAALKSGRAASPLVLSGNFLEAISKKRI
jgi:hypothetical protein